MQRQIAFLQQTEYMYMFIVMQEYRLIRLLSVSIREVRKTLHFPVVAIREVTICSMQRQIRHRIPVRGEDGAEAVFHLL